MIDYLSAGIADFYVRKKIILPNEKEVYKYGVSLILNDVVTFSLILILSALFFKLRLGAEFLAVFCFTRIFTGGYHARRASLCRVGMLATWLCVMLGALLVKDCTLLLLTAILAMSYIIALPLIPVKHPNKTLTPQLIKRGRIGSAALYILFSLCSVLLHLYAVRQDAATVALSLSAVSVLAVIGKFTNERSETT